MQGISFEGITLDGRRDRTEWRLREYASEYMKCNAAIKTSGSVTQSAGLDPDP